MCNRDDQFSPRLYMSSVYLSGCLPYFLDGVLPEIYHNRVYHLTPH